MRKSMSGGFWTVSEVGVLICGVVAFAALKFRLRAMDHAKLTRLEMRPNDYRQQIDSVRIQKKCGQPLMDFCVIAFSTSGEV